MSTSTLEEIVKYVVKAIHIFFKPLNYLLTFFFLLNSGDEVRRVVYS